MANLHKDFVDDNNHSLTSRTYADISARDADTDFQVTANIDKAVRIDSPTSYFILVSVSPAVWAEAGSSETDTLSEILANGNTTGGSDIIVDTGDMITITDSPSLGTDGANKDYVDSQVATQDTFIELTDTPSSYLGEQFRVIRVNSGETALEYSEAGMGTIVGPVSTVIGSVPTYSTTDGFILQDPNTMFIVGGSVGIGVTPDASAVLEATSASKGFLGPRGTEAERDNIILPATGLEFYNLTDLQLEIFDGTTWKKPAPDEPLAATLAIGNATGGTSISISPGDFIISPDGVGTGSGGELKLDAGDGGLTSGAGGEIAIVSGSGRGGNANSGGITIEAGAPNGSGSFGNLNLQSDGGNVGIGVALQNPTTLLEMQGTNPVLTIGATADFETAQINLLGSRNLGDSNADIAQISGFNFKSGSAIRTAMLSFTNGLSGTLAGGITLHTKSEAGTLDPRLVIDDAGTVNIITGTIISPDGASGGVDINITSGKATAGTTDGGDIIFTTGAGFGDSGLGGDLNFITGNSGGGVLGTGGGNVNFILGTNNGDPGANFIVNAGFGGNGGAVNITAGQGGIAGIMTLKGGSGGGTNTGGLAQLIGGNGGSTNAAGGAVQITGGLGAVDGNGGTATVAGGVGGSVSGNGGAVFITGRDGNTNNSSGGSVTIATGDGGSSSGDGGNLIFTTGSTSSGDGGAFTATLGTASTSNRTGGGFVFTPGAGTGVSPGGGFIVNGATGGPTGSGSGIVLNAGDGGATSGIGGGITLNAGAGGGSGADGLIRLLGGDVGIGTSTPSARLTVKEDSSNLATNTVSTIINENTTASNWAELKFSTFSSVASEVTGVLLGAQYLDHTDASIDADFVIKTTHNNILSERFRISDGVTNIVTGSLNINQGNIVSPDSTTNAVDITIASGDGEFGNGGSINLEAGLGGGAGGNMNLTAGNGALAGGTLTLTSGSVTSTGAGGTLTLISGVGAASSAGGQIHIFGGIGGNSSGIGGQVLIHAGSGGNSQGDGGLLSLEGGQGFSSGNTDGGNVDIQGGTNFGTGVHGDVLIAKDGGLVSIGSTPIASALLNVASVTKGFMQPRLTEVQRDTISSPANGLALHNTITRRPQFFDDSAWQKISVVAPQTIEISTAADLDKLASGGVITITSQTAIIMKANVTTSNRFDVNNGSRFTIGNAGEGYGLTYDGAGTFITSVDSIIVIEASLTATGGGTLFDVTGQIGNIINIDFVLFTGWKMGTISRTAGASVGPDVFLLHMSSLNWQDTLTLDNVSVLGVDEVALIPFAGAGVPFLEIKGDTPGSYSINLVSGSLAAGESLIRIDPGIADSSRITISGSTMGGTLFDTTGGTTGTFTAVADAFETIPISSVIDSPLNPGTAQFQVAGGTPVVFVGQEVTLGDSTDPAYNGTHIVSQTGVGLIELEGVAFVGDAQGTFESDSITITSTLHGLSELDSLVIDTDLSTDYDGGAMIYNVLTNTYQINRTFTTTHTGGWNTAGLDQTDPRVLAGNNPGFVNSQAVAFGSMNENTNTTTVTDGTYAPINVTGLTDDAVTERFKLIDAVAGVYEYTGNEPCSCSPRALIWATKAGSEADYRFAVSKNGAIPVFATAPYSPMEVKTSKVEASLIEYEQIVKGDTLQIMSAGDGTSDDPIITDFKFEIK